MDTSSKLELFEGKPFNIKQIFSNQFNWSASGANHSSCNADVKVDFLPDGNFELINHIKTNDDYGSDIGIDHREEIKLWTGTYSIKSIKEDEVFLVINTSNWKFLNSEFHKNPFTCEKTFLAKLYMNTNKILFENNNDITKDMMTY